MLKGEEKGHPVSLQCTRVHIAQHTHKGIWTPWGLGILLIYRMGEWIYAVNHVNKQQYLRYNILLVGKLYNRKSLGQDHEIASC